MRLLLLLERWRAGTSVWVRIELRRRLLRLLLQLLLLMVVVIVRGEQALERREPRELPLLVQWLLLSRGGSGGAGLESSSR